NVQYALAGGWAFSVLVEPRATTDIDILILLNPPSRETIQSLVSSVFTSTIVHRADEVQGYFDLALYWNPREPRDRGRLFIGRF
ncbi:MAG: hypothetical protein HC938_14290, partial [Nitrospira sp.]|nr:hypothetical protein [Nitrospira sp.]